MRVKKIAFIIYLVSMIFTLSACGLNLSDIAITDAKIVTAVDEKLMPVKVTDTFPKGTSKVSCWIEWRKAKINTQVVAKWHYVTDDIPILDYVFTIPKKEGMGSVTLAMPDGKLLPSGLYRIELALGKRVLKSLSFKIEQ